MRLGIITLGLILLALNNLFSQVTSKNELISYFDNTKNLDPIEGLWTLNVINTLYYYDDIIEQSTDEVRSEWGVKRVDKLTFKIINIGEGSEGESDFLAYFERSAINGFYTYKCDFKNPDVSVKSNAELSNNFLIEYGYFVPKEKSGLKTKGYRLHWQFIWTKKYPILSESKVIKSNEGEWKGNGTGFFIDKSGYIATNYHVVENANEIEVEYISNGVKHTFSAEVIQSDKQNDISVIKIKSNSFQPFINIPYNFKTQISDVGSNVFALGYPMALSLMGTEIKFTDGKISSKTGMQGDITTYQISVPIQPGNSGGPLFDYDGNLVGITSSSVNRELDITENVNYAIKTSYLRNLVDVLPYQLTLPNDKAILSKTLTEKIKVLSDYVVLIKIR